MERSEDAPCDDSIFEDGDSDAGSWDFERDIPDYREQLLESRYTYCGSSASGRYQNSHQVRFIKRDFCHSRIW